jgi:LCP family protein required for cell wall assembly
MPPSPRDSGPRSRSAFAAAFLSMLFPGLGHAYAGAFMRGLGFAALPFLSLALLAGVVLRANRIELFGFVVQQPVLYALLVANAVTLVYRIIAAVDAWQVARFLNAVDASGGGRLGRVRLPVSVLSVAGLLAVLLVMAGGHLAVARYNVLALDLVNCVFTENGDPSCDLPQDTPAPGSSVAPSGSADAGSSPGPSDFQASPIATGVVGTMAPTLPPWDGKAQLNILLIGSDQRPGDSSFNTDTMIVVSIDPGTKQVAMFQVPRDTVDVPVPPNARALWGSVYKGKINSWFTQNRNRTDLWPGSTPTARGFAALKAILGQLYGLNINYYVMVNFDGFTKVVDTVGGLQINVQIPVYESDYPAGGALTRIYIPAGPQHMTGAQALIYARSRHNSAGGDFDRGLRQQRVLISLKDQMNPQAIVANLPELVSALQTSVKTDISTGDLAKLLGLAAGVDTKNVRSYVFSPPYYATTYNNTPRGDIIEPNIARIQGAVKTAFTIDPAVLAQRDRLSAEAAQVWVVNASGRAGLASSVAGYLGYEGMEASAPNKSAPSTLAKTKIVVYNGAESSMTATITYLETLFGVTSTLATDASVPADIVVTLGKDAPNLSVTGPG